MLPKNYFKSKACKSNVKFLIMYPVKLNTKYSLALRMLCIDLLNPLGLKATSSTVSLVILRLKISSALKRVLKQLYTLIIMLFLSTYILIFAFHI